MVRFARCWIKKTVTEPLNADMKRCLEGTLSLFYYIRGNRQSAVALGMTGGSATRVDTCVGNHVLSILDRGLKFRWLGEHYISETDGIIVAKCMSVGALTLILKINASHLPTGLLAVMCSDGVRLLPRAPVLPSPKNCRTSAGFERQAESPAG